MFLRLVIVLALIVLAVPVTAQSGSIRASATVVSTPAVVQQSPAMLVVAERLSATLGVPALERNDPWVGYDLQLAFIGSTPWNVHAIRRVVPGAAPDEGSEFRADTEGVTVWAWTEGSEDDTAHMIIADLSRD